MPDAPSSMIPTGRPPKTGPAFSTGLLALFNAADAAETLCFAYIIAAIRMETPPDSERDELGEGAIASAVFVGMLFGGLFGGKLGDMFSKRTLLMAAVLVEALVGVGTGLVAGVLRTGTSASARQNLVVFLVVARVITGVAVGGSIPLIYALAGEGIQDTAHGAAKRAQRVNGISIGWTAGSVFTGVMAWLMLSRRSSAWPALAVVAALPCFVAFVWMLMSPDSSATPSAAAAVLPDEGLQSGDVEADLISEPPRASSRERPGSTRTIALTCIVWFGLSFAAYGVSVWITSVFAELESVGNPYAASLLYAVSSAPGNALSIYVVDRVSRRFFLIAPLLGASFFALMTSIFTQNNVQVPVLIVGTACAFAMCITVSWTSLGLTTSERLSGIGGSSSDVGLATAFGRCGSIIANVINPFLMDKGLVLFVASVVVFGAALAGLAIDHAPNGQDAGSHFSSTSSSPSHHAEVSGATTTTSHASALNGASGSPSREGRSSREQRSPGRAPPRSHEGSARRQANHEGQRTRGDEDISEQEDAGDDSEAENAFLKPTAAAAGRRVRPA